MQITATNADCCACIESVAHRTIILIKYKYSVYRKEQYSLSDYYFYFVKKHNLAAALSVYFYLVGLITELKIYF